VHEVIEDVEVREGVRVVRRRVIRTDDPQYPSGFRYSRHYGCVDGRGTILRYDNENETVGRHERHDADGVARIEFPGMMELRERFLNEIEDSP
jgi:hypothetical protein